MSTAQRFARPVVSLFLPHAGGATTIGQAINQNGLLRQVIITAPAAVDASATLTINVLDSDNNVIYTKAAVAANTVSNNLLTQDLSVPLAGSQTVQVVFSAAQTVTDTTTKVALLIGRV